MGLDNHDLVKIWWNLPWFVVVAEPYSERKKERKLLVVLVIWMYKWVNESIRIEYVKEIY